MSGLRLTLEALQGGDPHLPTLNQFDLTSLRSQAWEWGEDGQASNVRPTRGKTNI